MHELVRERKLSLVERLEGITWEVVMDLAIDLRRVQVREQVSPPTLQPVEASDLVNKNMFIEQVLPRGIVRKLTEEEMNHYID